MTYVCIYCGDPGSQPMPSLASLGIPVTIPRQEHCFLSLVNIKLDFYFL